jgi:magnesium transporter
MKKIIAQFPQFQWFDLIAPTSEDLDQLSEEFQIPRALLQDCLDPVKLPKYEKSYNIQFFLFRVFDKNSAPQAENVPTLTRKIAVFMGAGFLITIHRMAEPEIFTFSQKCLEHTLELEDQPITPNIIFAKLFEEGMRTFYSPLEKIEDELEEFESQLFSKEFHPQRFQTLHHHRRKLSLFKRLLFHSQDLALRVNPANEVERINFQDLKETLAHLLFITDELLEDTTNLLNLQISLASQKTNEVMRVLTIFSVFFMPLTFIVGVYGMNFKFMPELEWQLGYFIVWGAMLSVTFVIWTWFRRKGWIGNVKDE